MRIILLISCAFYSFVYYSQDYLFNGVTDSVIYNGITNSLYVNKGFPMSMDGLLFIKKTETPNLFAIKVNKETSQNTMLYIIDYLENPETNKQEKVVIDKIIIQISSKKKEDSLCLFQQLNESDSIDISIKTCGNYNRGLSIIEYVLSFDNQEYPIKSPSLTQEIKRKLYELKTGTKIKCVAICKDLSNEIVEINQTFTK